MGSGKWFKAVFRLKKVKTLSSKSLKESSGFGKANSVKVKNSRKGSCKLTNGSLDIPIEDVAAIQIQTAFRGYKARKALRRLKGTVRLQSLTRRYPVQRQSTSTLGLLHSWCKIQSQIRARRLCMVTEGRVKQKKIENQQKLEAKLQGLEAEWNSGSETMDDILARIYQREEASVKRERAMAYAFSHQWRVNCSQSQGLGSDELGKANWGWSWKERWIAARPWESRVSPQLISPKKVQAKTPKTPISAKTPKTPLSGKTPKTPLSAKTPKTPLSRTTPSSNGKGTAKTNGKTSVSAKAPTKGRRLSFPSSEKPVPKTESPKVEEASETKKEESVS